MYIVCAVKEDRHSQYIQEDKSNFTVKEGSVKFEMMMKQIVVATLDQHLTGYPSKHRTIVPPTPPSSLKKH